MKRKGLTFKIIILLIVSAAFVMAKFGKAGAQEVSPATDIPTVQQDTPGGSDNSSGDTFKGFGGKEDESLLMPVLKLVGALLLVVVAIYGFLFLLKKMMSSGLPGTGGRMIEVIESSAVAPKKSVALVRYSDRAVLIGIADNAISVLAELDPEETQKVLKEASSGRKPAGFKGILDSAKGRIDNLGLGGLKAVMFAPKKSKTQTA